MEKQTNIPQLRFPEFTENWNEDKMGDIFSFKVSNSFSRENLNYEEGTVKNIHYGDIHTKFQTLFDITKERVPYINSEISIDRISEDNYCQEGDLIFADASEDLNDVGKSIEVFNLNNEKLLSGLHTILARPNLEKFDIGFGGYLFKSNKVRTKIQKEAQGSKVLSISATRLANLLLDYPSQEEQKKIVKSFIATDEKILALKKKQGLLKKYKKGVMQKLFSQELRFKDKDGIEFPEWAPKKIGDSLDYEQPTKYLVSSTEYSDQHSTPVVTAGKTFILGYTDETSGIFSNDLPVIIFDDFTTASQFVDFPFKAKSSAMKILKAKEDTDIKFMYEALQMIRYETGAHGRHWISVFAEMEILTPDYKEQIRISTFLTAIDEKIKSVNTLLIQTENWKKGLLQKMFC